MINGQNPTQFQHFAFLTPESPISAIVPLLCPHIAPRSRRPRVGMGVWQNRIVAISLWRDGERNPHRVIGAMIFDVGSRGSPLNAFFHNSRVALQRQIDLPLFACSRRRAPTRMPLCLGLLHGWPCFVFSSFSIYHPAAVNRSPTTPSVWRRARRLLPSWRSRPSTPA